MKIEACTYLSPRDIQEKIALGFPVVRTPHIGNQPLSSMALASIGVPLWVFDRTIASKDLNYHPHLLLRGGRATSLAECQECFVPYMVGKDAKERPARLHYRILKELFGGVVFLESERLLDSLGLVRVVLETAAERTPGAFNRYVCTEGCVVSQRSLRSGLRGARCDHGEVALSENELAEQFIALLQNVRDIVALGKNVSHTGGPLPCIELTLVLCSIVLAHQSGKTDVYELSGPDMLKYATSKVFLGRAYGLFRELLHSGVFSGELSIKIVPTSDFRMCHVDGLDESVRVSQLRRELFFLKQAKRAAQARQDRALIEPYERALSGCARELSSVRSAWDPYYDIADASFFSHHDLHESGGGLVIDEDFMAMPFGDMRHRVVQMRQSEETLISRL